MGPGLAVWRCYMLDHSLPAAALPAPRNLHKLGCPSVKEGDAGLLPDVTCGYHRPSYWSYRYRIRATSALSHQPIPQPALFGRSPQEQTPRTPNYVMLQPLARVRCSCFPRPRATPLASAGAVSSAHIRSSPPLAASPLRDGARVLALNGAPVHREGRSLTPRERL